MSQGTESPSTAIPTTSHAALAVILYGYDEWWLALPRSDADANEAIRTCNWLYISESSNNTPSPKESSFSYVIKERVKVVTSSCFLKNVTVERTGKTTYSLSKSEKERIDNAFALRLALEAKEQAAEASRAQRQAKAKPDDELITRSGKAVAEKSAEGKRASVKAAGSKRSREVGAEEVIDIDTSQSDADVSGGGLRKGKAAAAATAVGSGHGARATKGADSSKAGRKGDSKTESKEGRGRVPPLPPLPPILPNPPTPSVACVVAIILSLSARDTIFGVPSQGNAEALSAFRLHMALWDADVKACRLVERVPNPSARREDGADVDAMLHVYGPLLKEGVDFRFVPTDATQASAKGSSSMSILPAAVATKGVAVFELKVEDAKILEEKRRADFLRRQELANLPPPPMPTLVNVGGDNWAFCGAIVPPPCLPSKPKGIITPRQMLAQQRRGTPEDETARDSQQQEFYHFLHNGVVHSVPVAIWNKKMSELSADHFCRDTAKEAELSAKGFFLLLKHMRTNCM